MKKPNPWDLVNQYGGSVLPEAQQTTARNARLSYRRTRDMAAPIVLQIPVATDTTQKSWYRLPPLSVPSVLLLTSGPKPLTHDIFVMNHQPTDASYPTGEAAGGYNANGQAFLLATEEWWVYIPNSGTDGTTISATINDASSELPAQAAALATASSNTEVTTVQTLNRAAFKTDTLVTAATFPGTAVNYGTSVTVPNSFSVTITALPSNSKYVYFGYDATHANATHGVELSAGMSVSLQVSNWNLIWISTDVGGEGVSIVSET